MDENSWSAMKILEHGLLDAMIEIVNTAENAGEYVDVRSLYLPVLRSILESMKEGVEYEVETTDPNDMD